MHEFKPRGMIKWAPFSALTAYEDEVGNIFHQMDEVSFIPNSPEKLADLNDTLTLAIEKKLEIEIIYHYSGQLQSISSCDYSITANDIKIGNLRIDKASIYQIIIK